MEFDAAAARQRIVEAAEHNGAMEGFEVSRKTTVDADNYVAGRITSIDLVERVRRRYRLT